MSEEAQQQSSSSSSSSSSPTTTTPTGRQNNKNTNSNNNSVSSNNLLHSKIRIKSDIPDLSNLIGQITEVKRGGWFVTDNPKIVRPIRAREFDVIGHHDDDDDDVEKEADDAAGTAAKINDNEEEEESHFSDGNKDDDAKDNKQSQKETDDDDDDDEPPSDNDDNNDNTNKKQTKTTSHNYDKDRFLKLGTTIKITSGEFQGRICTISERRVGIFLKISVGGDVRLLQPDEIEVIQFANDTVPDAANEEEEEEESDDDDDDETKGKDFGHKKYIGATVRVGLAVPGRKQRAKATVDDAFSGEWYLVSDPEIVKALDPAQFEVVNEGNDDDDDGSGGGKGGGKRKRLDDNDEGDDDDDDNDDNKVSSKYTRRKKRTSRRKRSYSDSDDEDEEEEEEDFLSSMQYCGEAVVPDESPKKSLRKRKKQINYAEDMESSDDDMESWEEEEDNEEEEKGQKEGGVEVDDNDDDDDDDDDESERKPAAPTNPVVDLTETSEEPKEGKAIHNAKPPDGDDTDSSDNDDNNNNNNIKMEEDPVTAAPVILHPKKVDNNKVELLLSGMSHLAPDTKIEIFNRKTGRVMRGEEAILLQDLPTVLLRHAEYEPIIPPPQAATENEADDKKAAAEEETSSPVDPNFNPYDNSVLIGVTAVVKNGPYKGLTGKIREIQDRGRWLLDHEAVKSTVRSSDCHFIDDGKVDKGAIAAHYQTKKKTAMPAFVKPGTVKLAVNKDTTAVVAKVRRVGRTDTNVRVSNVIIPQTRVRASAVEGKRVLVTGGEFRGLSGTISSCIPGGWYLISNLYDDDHELDVLINSEKLELINDVSSQMLPMLGHTHERIKSSIHLKASQLRLSALEEKKQKLSESATDADRRTKKHLEEIDREMKSLTAKIAAICQNSGTSS